MIHCLLSSLSKCTGDPEGSIGGTEIELSDLDHLGRISDRHGASESSQTALGSVDYAGSRSGLTSLICSWPPSVMNIVDHERKSCVAWDSYAWVPSPVFWVLKSWGYMLAASLTFRIKDLRPLSKSQTPGTLCLSFDLLFASQTRQALQL